MPRLVGKQSNEGLIVSLLMIAAIAIATGLEYTGIINVVPGFGKDNPTFSANNPSVFSDSAVINHPVQK
jgi:hypothetical protein